MVGVAIFVVVVGGIRFRHGAVSFNAQGKRQTSFVSLDVMPDIEEDVDVEINDDDLRIDTYRSSGAGGQHINKTSSAIRITHIPTGIVVQCQNERSQFQNKDKAMQMLKAKLYMLKKEANAEKLSDIRGEVKEIGWGNQIRSYVMQPYTLVKDHRTNAETGNVDAVLDGALDPFINAYLKWIIKACIYGLHIRGYPQKAHAAGEKTKKHQGEKGKSDIKQSSFMSLHQLHAHL